MGDGTNTSGLALVVVTRDRAAVFERFVLPSLAHAAAMAVEVVVVDQSAGSETRELVGGLAYVRYLRSDPGLSRGRNAGVAATNADLIAFTDDDVEFGREWLPRIRALFDDPVVGIVCGRGLDSRGRVLSHRRAGTYRWPTNPFNIGHGFNMAFRRKALDEAGPFDEGFGAGAEVPAAEDTDMFYRVMRNGWAARCDDSITVRHHDWRDHVQQRATYHAYGRGFAAQTLKHVRAGDVKAAQLAVRHLAHHAKWLALSLLRRDRGSLRYQWAWVRGVVAGIARPTGPQVRAR